MERENQLFEEDSPSSRRKSDIILLIALLAFIVFVAVAVLLIIFDTMGPHYPGSDQMFPMQPTLVLLGELL